MGNIVVRMAHPGSELAMHAWLQQRSGLDERLGCDFEAMDLNRLYRASDALYMPREALQDHRFAQAQSIFGLDQTMTLCDLTNTCFEGIASEPASLKDMLKGLDATSRATVAMDAGIAAEANRAWLSDEGAPTGWSRGCARRSPRSGEARPR